MIKNYYIQFMDNTHKMVTASQAGAIAHAIHQGKKAVILDGDVHAIHQVKAVKRISKDEEKFMLENAGVVEFNAPPEKLNQAISQFSIEAQSKSKKPANLQLI